MAAAEARFPIIIEGNAEQASTEAADAMAKLRDEILGSTSKVKAFSDEMRRLKGTNEDVVRVKNELKAKINSEQAAISTASVALSKYGKTLSELNDEQKKMAADAQAAKLKSYNDEQERLRQTSEQAAASQSQLEASIDAQNAALARATLQQHVYAESAKAAKAAGGNDKAKQDADAINRLGAVINASTENVKGYEAELSRLRGSSAEVVAAKTALEASIKKENALIEQATLDLTKYGKTLAQVDKASKGAGGAHKKEASGAGRAAAALKGLDIVSRGSFRRMNELKESVAGAGGATGIAILGFAALALAITKATSAAIEGALSFAKWIIESANAQRSFLLTEQGALGTATSMLASAQSAKNFAAQIDDLAGRVPQARDELVALGNELSGKGLSGQPLVDAMNAIAQTAGAKGQAAADLLKSRLIAGLGGGAAAARAAAEKQFGALNASKLLDLNTQTDRFKETMVGLTRDINLTPLLTAIQSILGFFSADSVTGAAIKQIVTAIGDQIGKWAEAAAPFIKNAMKQLLILGLQAGIVFLQLYHRVRDAFGPDNTSSVDLLKASLTGLKFFIDSVIGGVIAMYAVWRTLTAALHEVIAAVDVIEDAFGAAKQFLSQGWGDIGKQIIDGLIAGITAGAGAVANAVEGVATKAKDTFKGLLGIHSPSTVFADMGQSTTAGFAQGVDSGASQVKAATTGMASSAMSNVGGANPLAAVAAAVAPPASASSSVATSPAAGATPAAPTAIPSAAPASPATAGASKGASVSVTVNINVGGGGDKGGDVAKQLTQSNMLDQITKAVEDALATVGMVPVPG